MVHYSTVFTVLRYEYTPYGSYVDAHIKTTMNVYEQETPSPPSSSSFNNYTPTEISSDAYNYTPRKDSRLSLSRIKRERRKREMAARSCMSNLKRDDCYGGVGEVGPGAGAEVVQVNDDDGVICRERREGYDLVTTESNHHAINTAFIGDKLPTQSKELESSPDDNKNDEEFNFDLGEMDSSSSDDSSDGDGGSYNDNEHDNCFYGNDSDVENMNMYGNIPAQSLSRQTSSVDLDDDNIKNNSEIDHGSDRGSYNKKYIFLDDDDDDDDIVQTRASSRRKRRITICEDNDEDDNDSDLDKRTAANHRKCHRDPYTFETQQSQNNISSPLLSPRRDDSPLLSPTRDTDLMSPHNDDTTQDIVNSMHQTTAHLLSPKELQFETNESAKPSRTAYPVALSTGAKKPSPIRQGLRTSPFPRHSFSRVFHNTNSPLGGTNEDLIESSDSDCDSDIDDLLILPKKKKSLTREKECGVICLDSDDDGDDGDAGDYNQDENNAEDYDLQQAIRTSLLPEWGGSRSKLGSGSTSNLHSTRKRARNSSSSSTEPISNTRLSAVARNSLRRVSNDAPLSISIGGSNRRDLTGGSGLGLGGFQVRTEYEPFDEDGDNEEMPPPASRSRKTISTRTASSSRSRSNSTASTGATTRGRKRKTTKKKYTKKGGKGGKGRKRNYKRKGNNSFAARSSSGGAWSSNERGISSFRGRNGSSSGQYMEVGNIDPNLGSAGGASISFE